MEKEINLHTTTDAAVWASEFKKVVAKQGFDLLKDEDWLHTWFANAITCGYEHGCSNRDNQYIYILKSHTGSIVKIYDYEPTITEMDEDYNTYLNDPSAGYSVGIAGYNCILYRWRKIDSYFKKQPIQVWNGRAETAYNWKEI